MITGGHDISGLSVSVGSARLMYGSFIQNIINFFIIAACIFVMVKIINKLTKKEEKKQEVKKADDVILLEEIRDLLKKELKEK
jgi:large conductance mechanosensitive channel